MITYHLVPQPYFEVQDPAADYRPEPFEREGFIHTTLGDDEVIVTANRHCRADPRPYLLLEIDLARVRPLVRHDDDRGIYPHIYGPLNRDAIIAVRAMRRQPDGTFVSIEPPPGTPQAEPRP